ncbi:GNAT family N-acetyltransferase [Aureimonas sp. SA4125]|uniref:bifunctional helix-turn-helix transcriptional regulator/GNAT family N-acetyltransferase n=1 Tax=Aureimonas sp. SA4125 TaxID=2826993 RepID=UPI001CC3C571|nr:bifunctional helix-turn-helix transcriptional regulator/GNAT family N-acetyltransferase [Aureimonas sp. SA4125]BDA85044.1 GNAT family N-acetyltransferase [Aureimonas sp. SA4125]
MASNEHIAVIRAFNRFYTRQIGLLEDRLLHSPFTLVQARLIYEIATRRGLAASDLAADLGMDPGLLSRMLKTLVADGIVARLVSDTDQRRAELRLTETGSAAFDHLDAASAQAIGAWLSTRSDEECSRMVAAMTEIRRLVEHQPAAVVLCEPAVGDLALVTHRQALLYAEEYGFDARYEALVARIVSDFVQSFVPGRERCWIADRAGTLAGSVFVVCQSETVAKLRLLYVEPAARGEGLGARLVDEAVCFAAACGYKTMTLWTNSVLVSARRLYEAAGFSLVAEEPHHSFGQDLIGQTWEKSLVATPSPAAT